MRATKVLDEVSFTSDPLFAIDHTNRIIVWSNECAKLTGFPAAMAIGKHCYDLLAGRDIYSNSHCYRNCPVSHQAIDEPDKSLHPFVINYCTAGGRRDFLVTPVVVRRLPASAPIIVHVLAPVALGDGSPRERSGQARAMVKSKVREQKDLETANACELTEREVEILAALAGGLSTGEIAGRLSIAPVTVRNHIQHILHKLGVHTRSAAVGRAYEAGIVGRRGGR